MKEWDYYRNNEPCPLRKETRKELKEVIDNQPMTAREREAAYKELEVTVDEQHKANMKLYREKQHEKHKEFCRDARAEIGYDQYLDEEGCQALESYAYEESHSGGYGDVFGKLADLSELIGKLRWKK